MIDPRMAPVWCLEGVPLALSYPVYPAHRGSGSLRLTPTPSRPPCGRPFGPSFLLLFRISDHARIGADPSTGRPVRTPRFANRQTGAGDRRGGLAWRRPHDSDGHA